MIIATISFVAMVIILLAAYVVITTVTSGNDRSPDERDEESRHFLE